jgi:hypothetical protein
MEQQYREWSLRTKPYQAGDAWGALVEVWAPGTRRTSNGVVVPFTRRASSPSEAEEAGTLAARAWIDAELR